MINHITIFRHFRPLKNCFRLTPARQTSDSAAYDGDGKTTVKVLNDEFPHLNLINTYSHKGFRLSNNLFIHGSIIVFPTQVYSWNVRRGIDITMESLIVFDLIVPKLKMLVIGYGQHGEPFDASIPLQLKKKGISCEMLPSSRAVTTYNFMVSDAVHVAGAFVPVQHVQVEYRDQVALSEYDTLMKRRPWFRGEDYWRETVDTKYERAKLYRKDFEKQKTFDD